MNFMLCLKCKLSFITRGFQAMVYCPNCGSGQVTVKG